MAAPFPTGDDILAFVGIANPSAAEADWANAVAAAVEAGMITRLNDANLIQPWPVGMNTEIRVAAMLAGSEAFKRREAVFGLTGYADLEGNAIRVARDYLEGTKPIADRYGTPGIG